jgi:collagenase-like PrtC family protease
MAVRISLGPVLYFWSADKLREFYREIAGSSVDIVYLGETICSKRRSLTLAEWIEIGEELQSAGKEVVLSTLALLEAESELKSLKRICNNGKFMVEANDMAAVQILSSQSIPFVVGHSINLYNQRTISVLAKHSMRRWVAPVELSKYTIKELHQSKPEGVESELFVWGRIPLSYAARCYTARHYDLPKDECQYKCIEDPDGILLETKENEEFLTINGIQTQSAQSCNLLPHLEDIADIGIDIVRISPQSSATLSIIELFNRARSNQISIDERIVAAKPFLHYGGVDGYWMGKAGMKREI